MDFAISQIGASVSALAALYFLHRSAKRAPRETTDGLLLEYPPLIAWVGGTSAVLFGCATTLSYLAVDAPWWVPLVFAFFALLGLFLFATAKFTWFELGKDGVRYGIFPKGSRLIIWDEITEVQYGIFSDSLVLVSGERKKIRIPSSSRGMPELALTILKKFPERCSKIASKFLERKADVLRSARSSDRRVS